MPEQWIVEVEGKEYGPANLETLREWKAEGRVLPANAARRTDLDAWATAAEIPGLFETRPLPIIAPAAPVFSRSVAKICADTFRIYRKGFFQFSALTLLVFLPSLCAHLTSLGLDASSAADVDLRKRLAEGFTFCMHLLTLALLPIYISGIQVATAELEAGRRVRFFGLLNAAVKFWPRVAMLSLFVYGAYIFWTVLPLGLMATITLGGSPSLVSSLIALSMLALWVWIIGRLFVNFLFWQQFAVLEGSDVANALRQSKELARSGRNISWYRRPLWRAVLLVTIWFSVVLALNIGPAWPSVRQYFHAVTTTQNPEAMMEAVQNISKTQGVSVLGFGLSLLQSLLRPLLGIAFVLLYFDARSLRSNASL
jgi:GYF domain 2